MVVPFHPIPAMETPGRRPSEKYKWRLTKPLPVIHCSVCRTMVKCKNGSRGMVSIPPITWLGTYCFISQKIAICDFTAASLIRLAIRNETPGPATGGWMQPCVDGVMADVQVLAVLTGDDDIGTVIKVRRNAETDARRFGSCRLLW